MRKMPIAGFSSRKEAVIELTRRGLRPCQIEKETGIDARCATAYLHSAGKRRIIFDEDVIDDLEPYAKPRGLTASEVARRIVLRTLEDELVDAVLDDGITQVTDNG